MKHRSIPVFFFLLLTAALSGQSPVELGRVHWQRDFDAGLAQAAREGKAVFLLFQEVPGCSTCQRYGQEVLSHPLIVEAIETLFVPVAIFNNKKGKDAEVLAFYHEPSWNNPVVRIVGADKADLAPRVSGNYSPLGVVRAMIFALQRADREVPAYLDLLREEFDAQARGAATATLAMYCFWTGEKELGRLDGVVATEPGYMHGREVVRVQYDPATITLAELVRAGQQTRCADRVFVDEADQQAQAAKVVGAAQVETTGAYRPDRDNKYFLSQTAYRSVPMTALQAARANALIGQGKSPDTVLSPRQQALARTVAAHPERTWRNVVGQDITAVWE